MRKVLGKGLDSLIPEQQGSSVQDVSVNEIVPNKYQMRSDFNSSKIEELSETIREQGIVQPLLVTHKEGKYMLIAGERRLRAAKKAGLRRIPCIVRDVSEEEALVVSLIENIQREDLSPVEEAVAYRRMVKEFSMTQEEISEKVGKSRPTVANTLRILTLPKDLIELIKEGKLTSGHARALLQIDNPKKRKALALKIVREKLTVREAERLAGRKSGNAKKRKKKSDVDKSPEVKDMENKMEKSLGTKVNIKMKNASGKKISGAIEIDFYSMDDFEKIADIICTK